MRLSKSQIEQHRKCPRCFYLDRVEGIKWPEGIKSGLPMGMDRVLKNHFDTHRAAGTMPDEVLRSGKVPVGTTLFPDQGQMKRWRYWKTGPTAIIDGVEVGGALDELFVRETPQGRICSMADYKTKAKETNEADTAKFYQVQANVYDLLLNLSGFKTDGLAYFIYYSPRAVGAGIAIQQAMSEIVSGVTMEWNCQVVVLKADQDGARRVIAEAAACLGGGKLPDPGEGCEQCAHVAERTRRIAEIEAAQAAKGEEATKS